MEQLEFSTVNNVRIQIAKDEDATVSISLRANRKTIWGAFNRDETAKIVAKLQEAFTHHPMIGKVEFKSRKDFVPSIIKGWKIEKSEVLTETVKLTSPTGELLTLTRNDLQAAIDKLFPPAASERVNTVFDVKAIEEEGGKVITILRQVMDGINSFKDQLKKL